MNDEEHPSTPQPSADQAPETTNNEEINNETPLELPENMNLDGNEEGDEKDQEEEGEEEENPLENDPSEKTMEDQPEEENDQMNTKENGHYNLPEPGQDEGNEEEEEEEKKDEQSALTRDQTNQQDSTPFDQPNELKNKFANAETFEKEKDLTNETIGESTSSKKTSQNEQISSNRDENQITQELTNQSKNNDQSSNSKSNDQRTLSEILSQIDEKIKAALDLQQIDNEMTQSEENPPGIDQDNDQTQLYAHAKNIQSDNEKQKQILDSATEEQTQELHDNDEQRKEPMMMDEQPIEENPTLQNEPMKKSQSTKKTTATTTPEDSSKIAEEENAIIPTDKSFISTSTVEHQFDFVTHLETKESTDLTEQIEYQLEEWYTHVHQDQFNQSNDAEQLWTHLENLTQPYVFELCEQLRLLLEPTQRTKYSGDYRTGKRLNMKRIIPYIASDFRKDRIWLRRLKPSKRQYQLILAIDDSQSMDNLQVKRLALESLILLGQTLNLLDIGQFGIVSFGQFIRTLQPLSQSFNHQNGIEILKQLKFDQTKTLLAEVKTKQISSSNSINVRDRSRQ